MKVAQVILIPTIVKKVSPAVAGAGLGARRRQGDGVGFTSSKRDVAAPIRPLCKPVEQLSAHTLLDFGSFVGR